MNDFLPSNFYMFIFLANIIKQLRGWSRTLSIMMANGIPETKLGEKSCLDIGVDFNTDCAGYEDDVEAAPKELLDIINRHEMRCQSNIKLPLKVNLGIEIESKIVFVGVKLDIYLKNQLIAMFDDFKDFLLGSTKIY